MGDALSPVGNFVDEAGNALSGADVTSALGQSVGGDALGQAGQILGGSPDQGALIGAGLEGPGSDLATAGGALDAAARTIGASIGGGFAADSFGGAGAAASDVGAGAANVTDPTLGPLTQIGAGGVGAGTAGAGGGAAGVSALEGGAAPDLGADPTAAAVPGSGVGLAQVPAGGIAPIDLGTSTSPALSIAGQSGVTGTPATPMPTSAPLAGPGGGGGGASALEGGGNIPAGALVNPSQVGAGSPALQLANAVADTTPAEAPVSLAAPGAPNVSGVGGAAAPGASAGGASPTTTSAILDFIRKNAMTGLGLAGIGFQAANRPKIPNIGNLNQIGNQVGGVTNSLINSEATGQLPPGQQQLVTNALNDTIAGIKSKFANLNLSGSTMEQQEISAARERAVAETADLARQATQTGLDAAGLEDRIFSQIAQLKLAQDQELSQAIANFAGNAALGSGLRLAQSATA